MIEDASEHTTNCAGPPRIQTEQDREQVLKKAVTKLGLREVVETIANHIRLRKSQVGGAYKYRSAIGKWERDLKKLRKEYYKGSRADFQWPSTDG